MESFPGNQSPEKEKNMAITPDFSQGYPTAEAERGKFVVLDPSTITGLPSGSRGKYAVLTYNVNGSGSNGGSVVEIAQPSNIEIKSQSINTTREVISFAQSVRRIEIFNTNPQSTIYVSLNPDLTTDFDTLTSIGMPIERYYSTDFQTDKIAIGATESSDVRIIGHF